MLRSIRHVVLVAGCVFALAGPAPSTAYAYGSYDDTPSVDTSWSKKKRHERRMIMFAGLGVILSIVLVLVGLNAMDRGAERKAIRQRELERERANSFE
jgi:hypothetical protein